MIHKDVNGGVHGSIRIYTTALLHQRVDVDRRRVEAVCARVCDWLYAHFHSDTSPSSIVSGRLSLWFLTLTFGFTLDIWYLVQGLGIVCVAVRVSTNLTGIRPETKFSRPLSLAPPLLPAQERPHLIVVLAYTLATNTSSVFAYNLIIFTYSLLRLVIHVTRLFGIYDTVMRIRDTLTSILL